MSWRIAKQQLIALQQGGGGDDLWMFALQEHSRNTVDYVKNGILQHYEQNKKRKFSGKL